MRKSGGTRHGNRPRPSARRELAAGFLRQQFDRLVEAALEELPETFRSKLEAVSIVVQDSPEPGLLKSLGMRSDDLLFGLYDGIPLTERGDGYNLTAPDRILIFRKPILAVCSGPEEIREEVRLTVRHEIAHFYGIDDDELERMGFA